METEIILNRPLKEIANENPLFNDFFSSFQIKAENEQKSFKEYISIQPDSFWKKTPAQRKK